MMKRIFFMLVAVALMASCTKEDVLNDNNNAAQTLEAVIDVAVDNHSSANSRMEIVDELIYGQPTGAKQIKWSKNDLFSVFDVSKQMSVYKCTNAGTTGGWFPQPAQFSKTSGNADFSTLNQAIMPASCKYENEQLIVTVPSVYSNPNGAMNIPMRGQVDPARGYVTFGAFTMAVLDLKLVNAPRKDLTVKIKGDKIAGDFTLDQGTHVLTGGTSNEIQISHVSFISDVYLPLPATEIGHKLTVIILDGEKELVNKTATTKRMTAGYIYKLTHDFNSETK